MVRTFAKNFNTIDCTDQDYDVHFTECNNGKRSAFFFYKPPAVCLNGKLPAPITGLDCAYSCTNGKYFSTNSSACVTCGPGSYSLETRTNMIDSWTTLPPQMTTSCERTGVGNCNAWHPNGDYIDSGNNRQNHNIRSALEYKFEVQEAWATLAFSYQVSAENNWDFLNFMVDDQLIFKVSQQTWAEYAMNVTTGFHTAKWIYTKDPSIAVGEDMAKIRNIMLVKPAPLAFTCPLCAKGEYSDGTKPCEKCPAGTFAPEEGSSSCQNCPAMHNSYPGSAKCYLSSVPCTTADYFFYNTECDASNNQITKYQWIQPKLCNETADGSVTLPADATHACVPVSCKPGQLPANKQCEYCPIKTASVSGSECVPCATGTASTSRDLIYDNWHNQWPGDFRSECVGDCRNPSGWRLAGDHIDSGIGNGASDSYFIFSFEILNNTNIFGLQRAVVIDYSLSCLSGSLQVTLDDYIYTSVQCGGCADLNAKRTMTLPFMSPGIHHMMINMKMNKEDITNTTSADCDRAVIRSITVHGTAHTGGAPQCQRCPAGTFSDDMKTCETCPAGTSSADLAEKCEECPVDTFSPRRSAACYKCGEGFTAKAGSSSCSWKAGTCKYNWAEKNRTFDLVSAGKQWAEQTLASLDEPGTSFYLNLCGDVPECNAINAKACKYVPLTDDWVNLGNHVDFKAIPASSSSALMLSATITNYESFCRDNTTGYAGPIQSRIRAVCDATADVTVGAQVSRQGNCLYDFLIATRAACTLCTEEDWVEVEGSCDAVTLTMPIRYIKRPAGSLVVQPNTCSGGVDKSALTETRACTIPLPVAAWIPITIVAVFLGLLILAAIIIIVLYKKFRDVSMKYKQFIDESDAPVPEGAAPQRKRGDSELQSATIPDADDE